MATIQTLQRKNGQKYRVLIRLKGHPTVTKVFDKKKDAQEWIRVMEGNTEYLDVFPDATARTRTVGEAIDGFMLDYRGRDRSILGRLSWWKQEYGDRSLARLTQATIKDALRALAQKYAQRASGKGKTVTLDRPKSPATLNRYLGAISIAMEWAVEEKWIRANPAKGIKRKTEPRGRVRWLRDDERKALLDACDESEWPLLGLLARLALSTGARQSELLRLRWSDVDLRVGVAHVGETKNGEPRMLPLVSVVRERLEAMPRPIHTDLIFHSDRHPDQPFAFRSHWETAVQKAGLQDFRFHDLRHSCASYLAMAGASHVEIAEVLGHKSLQMVKRYSHLATSHKQQLVERVTGDLVK